MGQRGVIHGTRTYILQDQDGQIIRTHSISAGLDCPYVGPEHAWLKDTGRAEYAASTDKQAVHGFRILVQKEGIIPGELTLLFVNCQSLIIFYQALESSHAIWEAVRIAKTLPKGHDLVVVSSQYYPALLNSQISGLQCLSGRGDKDIERISKLI